MVLVVVFYVIWKKRMFNTFSWLFLCQINVVTHSPEIKNKLDLGGFFTENCLR